MTYLDEIKWKHPWRYRKAWWLLRIELWTRTALKRIVLVLCCSVLVFIWLATLGTAPAWGEQFAGWMDRQATKIWPEWSNEELPKPRETPQPTEEGKKRYDSDGFYTANSQPGTPCTCKDTCPYDCKGQCGCEACHEAYGDFLSCE